MVGTDGAVGPQELNTRLTNSAGRIEEAATLREEAGTPTTLDALKGGE